MFRRRDIARLLGIDSNVRRKHDYRQDTAFDGRRLVRLPDRTLVPAGEYPERLAAYEARLRDVERGDD